MSTNIQTKVAENLALVLGIPMDPATSKSRHEIPEWDSLKHIEIALMIEEEFGVRLSAEEIQRLDSLASITSLITEKHGS